MYEYCNVVVEIVISYPMTLTRYNSVFASLLTAPKSSNVS